MVVIITNWIIIIINHVSLSIALNEPKWKLPLHVHVHVLLLEINLSHSLN